MTREEFAAALRSIFGPGRGWKKRAAAALRVDPATLRRWLASGDIPGPAIAAALCWLGKADYSPA